MMKYNQDVKSCIEKSIEILKHRRYNEERMNALVETIERNGYESVITIDKFFEIVSLETRERWPWSPDQIILEVMITPKCKERLMSTIHLYNDFAGDVARFFKGFHMNNELEQITKLIIEKRDEYPKSFDALMGTCWEKGIECYYNMYNLFPNGQFFERMETKNQSLYDFSVARELLRTCINHMLENPDVPNAEVNFWNENILLVKKLFPKNELDSIISKRYMALIPSLNVMNVQVQELVIKRLGKRKERRIFKDGYTILIAYYIIGRILNGESCVENLMEKLASQKRVIDWKEIFRILKIACEEIDSYEIDLKESLSMACDFAEEHYQNEGIGYLAELLNNEELL